MLGQTTNIAAVALPTNPVWRSYAGGSVLRKFRGRPGTNDDHFPEDWLASTVRARNGTNSQGEDEGLSRFGGATRSRTVAEALESDPQFWFGSGEAQRKSMGVLWKLLDSSVRLQFQAHPDATFARQHLNSDAGKTECWYILGTRDEGAAGVRVSSPAASGAGSRAPNNSSGPVNTDLAAGEDTRTPPGSVYLGFQRPPPRTAWKQMIEEQAVESMLSCFDGIPVKAGDCFVVPAGTPHAIGAGVFMVELMEPTDWVVRCETLNAGVTLPPEACFMGLDLERCLDVFDYRAYSVAKVRETFQQKPAVLTENDSFSEEEVIRSPWHKFFRLHRLRGSGDAHWTGHELMLLIALRGSGELFGGNSSCVSAGETWLLPGAADKWEWRAKTPDWELLLAKLPKY